MQKRAQYAETGIGTEPCHEQGRCHSFAGDVAQQDGEALPRLRDEVVVVSADLEGGLVVREELVARDLRQPLRQEAALDLAGELQVELEPLMGQL
jgi:hypothetical protein